LSGKGLVRETTCPGNVLSGKRLSGKVIVRETSVKLLLMVRVYVCVWSQAKCLISHTTDLRGTVNDNSWSGRCLEPEDHCPADANDECVTDASFTMRTCYKCNIPPTCEGQLSSPSLCKQHVVLFHWLLSYFIISYFSYDVQINFLTRNH